MTSILLQHRKAVLAIGGVLLILVMILGFAERHAIRRALRGDNVSNMRAVEGILATSPSNAATAATDDRDMAGVAINDEGYPITKGQETYAQFEADHVAASKSESFHGDRCVTDCAEQNRGYAWARAHAIKSSSECSRPSDGFYSGCAVYAREQALDAQDEQLKNKYFDMVEKGVAGGSATR